MSRKKFIDIGANLTDAMYQGVYYNRNHHVADIKNVIERSKEIGLEKIMITGGTLNESRKALELARTDPLLYSTAGFHPTRCLELEDDTEVKIQELIKLCHDNPDKVVAVGEFGLDYDRLEFCPKDVQLKNFTKQLEVAEQTRLPLFLHCRNAANDLLSILKTNHDRYTVGVVHSFDGHYNEAMSFINMGFYIGLNGCSLKTDDNLEVVRKLPVDKLMIETDCPYCEIKPSRTSFKFIQTKFESVKKEKWTAKKMVKGRNEPCTIIQVLEVIAAIKEMDEQELADQLYANTIKVFFSSKK
ncbi:deoxyribonuclease TATDN1 [Dermatophagoides farinae]|uniref:Deoxyribonuclease TATDN1 n=1 Tax=Dermatophagoides farinae TaxID=6954 RepID=A0A9D4P176_DERFA|nr:putative deoxyribonuclease TATDN1 [Dermatophagoides farinae]KAH7642073.1 deoxyribonuclease tatdn1-like protein [Dermatophagoides farinae]